MSISPVRRPPAQGARKVRTSHVCLRVSLFGCTQTHNAVTFAVATLPDDPTFGQAGTRVLPAAIASHGCSYRNALRYVGHDFSSPLRLKRFWYLPTPAQYNAGARQVRCDLAVLQGLGFRPLPARPDAADFGGRAYQICSPGSHTAGPRTRASGACTDSSTFRLITYVELATRPGQPFPGARVAYQRTLQACPVLRNGDWIQYAKHAKVWDRGDTRGACWWWLG